MYSFSPSLLFILCYVNSFLDGLGLKFAQFYTARSSLNFPSALRYLEFPPSEQILLYPVSLWFIPIGEKPPSWHSRRGWGVTNHRKSNTACGSALASLADISLIGSLSHSSSQLFQWVSHSSSPLPCHYSGSLSRNSHVFYLILKS